MGEHKHEIRTELDIMAALCEMAEDVVPIHGITMINVIRPDGTTGRQWRIGGDPNIDQTLGLIELIKLDLYDRHLEDIEDDDQ